MLLLNIGLLKLVIHFCYRFKFFHCNEFLFFQGRVQVNTLFRERVTTGTTMTHYREKSQPTPLERNSDIPVSTNGLTEAKLRLKEFLCNHVDNNYLQGIRRKRWDLAQSTNPLTR